MKALAVDTTGQREADEFETIDEAIAEALAQVGPGGVVSIHDEDCEHDGEREESCTCMPMELVKGATA